MFNISILRVAWNHIRIKWILAFGRIRRYWSACSCFWLLDLLLLLGGCRGVYTLNFVGERKIYFFSQCVFAYQAILIVFQLFHTLVYTHYDAFELVLYATKVLGICISILKVLILIHLKAPITKLREFISSNRVNSGDAVRDEFENRKFNRSACIMLSIFYGLMVVDTILISIPNPDMQVVYGLPPPLQRFGGKYGSRLLSFLYVSFFPLDLFPRFFSNIACVGVLLMGMRAKLNILAYRYRNMLNHPTTSVEHFFNSMNQDLQETLTQHMDYWSHLQMLKMVVAKMFFLVHYFSITCIGILCYIFRDCGISIMTVFFVATLCVLLLEYYWWCHFVDSFQDVADSIGEVIFEICSKIPYDAEFHANYSHLRSSLMIIWINTRNGMGMKCLGLFVISTAAFVNLINAIYTVLTFLIDVV